jgi:hypothetical protein
MRILKTLFFLFAIGGIFNSCQKEYSLENGGNTGVGGTNPAWEFKEGTSFFNGGMDTAYITDLSPLKILTMEGTSANGTGTFSLSLNGLTGSISVGTYKSSSGQVEFDYTGAGGTFYEADALAGGDLTVIVSSISATNVSGTFSGTVLDGTGASKQVKDGKFNATIGTSSGGGGGGGGGTTTGTVMLWSTQNCNGANISIKMNNQPGTITSFYPSLPNCGAPGCPQFTLPTGSYVWKAYCGTDSISGLVVVAANVCTRVEVNFVTPPPQNCVISRFAGYNAVSGAPQESYNATFTGAQVTRILDVDSSSVPPTIYGDFAITYPAGKVQIDADQFFLVDANNRVTEYHGFEDPYDNTSTELIVKYTYNAAGYLIKSVWSAVSPAVDVFEFTYTYDGANNLTRIVSKLLPVGTVLLDVAYEYDVTKTPKNYRIFSPEPAIGAFALAINVGKISTNVISKITTKEFDQLGVLTSTSVSNLTSYVLDANNYVKEFTLTGDDQDYFYLYNGDKYRVFYKCF